MAVALTGNSVVSRPQGSKGWVQWGPGLDFYSSYGKLMCNSGGVKISYLEYGAYVQWSLVARFVTNQMVRVPKMCFTQTPFEPAIMYSSMSSV